MSHETRSVLGCAYLGVVGKTKIVQRMVVRLACISKILRLSGSVRVGHMPLAKSLEVYRACVTRFGVRPLAAGPP